eukprot:GHVH01008237.1.p1 GENE.GHVH01008237.1~~GHVH01008237.1.p1  ORF type:complete len:272 (-),score=40.43 GHVH01008237.1:469-1284(-)
MKEEISPWRHRSRRKQYFLSRRPLSKSFATRRIRRRLALNRQITARMVHRKKVDIGIEVAFPITAANGGSQVDKGGHARSESPRSWRSDSSLEDGEIRSDEVGDEEVASQAAHPSVHLPSRSRLPSSDRGWSADGPTPLISEESYQNSEGNVIQSTTSGDKDLHSSDSETGSRSSRPEELVIPVEYKSGNAYNLLGLQREFVLDGNMTNKDISKAFKKRALQLHPDKGGDVNEMQLLNQTNEFLTKHKVAYDEISGIKDRHGRVTRRYNDL